MPNNQNNWTFENDFEEYAKQNFFNPEYKIKFLNKMAEEGTGSEASLKDYACDFAKISSFEKKYNRDISQMDVDQIIFILNDCINSYDSFRNMKELLKLYLAFMNYPNMAQFVAISYDMMDVDQKFSEKFFASYEDLYGYLMSDSYIKENYIYELLAVLLIYLGMPEEYIPIIEAASVDVKNKTISVGGVVFDNYPESFFELCELSFQDKQCCNTKYLIKRENVDHSKSGDGKVDAEFASKACEELSYSNLNSHCDHLIRKEFSVLTLKRSALFFKMKQYEQNVQSMYSLKSSQLKALFEEEFDLKIGTPKLIYNTYLQWLRIFR